jgi:hypothetical protein
VEYVLPNEFKKWKNESLYSLISRAWVSLGCNHICLAGIEVNYQIITILILLRLTSNIILLYGVFGECRPHHRVMKVLRMSMA